MIGLLTTTMMFRLFLFVLFLTHVLVAREIIFGVVPQQSPMALTQKWTPLAEYLSQKIGHKVCFKTEVSIPKFEEKLYAGKYDLAYMNPYHYIKAHRLQHYQAQVRANSQLQGIIVGPNTVTKLDAKTIRGSTFLFPAPMAFAATLITKYELKKNFGVDVDKEAEVLYVNSHDSVYKGVARGIGNYGGGIVRTYENLKDQEAKRKIGILYHTRPYPSHPIGTHPSLPKEIRESLVNALLQTPDQLLKTLQIEKLVTTSDGEYESVQKLAQQLGIE